MLWALQGRNIIIARKEGNQIMRSVWSEVKKGIERNNLEKYFTFHKSDRMIIPKIGKGSIVFTGVDDDNKLKSITPPNADAFDTWIAEEADAFTADDIEQLGLRCRGKTAFPQRGFMIFNPVSIARLKWCWEKYFVPCGWNDEKDTFYQDEKTTIHRVTYKDNKYLTENDLAKFERLRIENPKKYRVYGEGKFGASGKTVFDVNKYHKSDFNIDEILQRGYIPRFGGDFGYVHNGTMIMSLWDKKNSTIYVFDMDCRNQTVKEDLAPVYIAMLDRWGYSRRHPILFDYAEPSSYQTLQNNGVLGATKCARKDVPAQTDFLQSQNIIIHENCSQLYEEMEALNFKVVNGKVTEDWDDSYGDDSVKGLAYAYSYEALQNGVCAVGRVVNI
jgi:phage terminase large subunit